MKRIIVQLFILLFVFSEVQSQPVSREEALKRAAEFLKVRGRNVVPDDLSVAYRGKRKGQDRDTTHASYYVLNNPLNSGFQIMSGDNRAMPVLAYSDSGTFSEEDMPEHLKFWMDSYSQQINGLSDVATSTAPKAAGASPMASAIYDEQRVSISPLIKTRWNQQSPFSDLCPSFGTKQCVTGCVATAMAQLMYYHQWPQDFTTEIPGFRATSISSDIPPLSPVLFNWEDMKLKYDRGDQDGNAVATLLAYCANSLKMEYSPYASAAFTSSVARVLKDNFRYDSELKYVRKMVANYSDEQWEQMIYNEIAEGRPVVLAGQASDGMGHAFVCDGYDNRTGLFHVNWGWGGKYDGYFRLTALKPQSNDGIGSSNSNDGYNSDQEAIIGIRPPADRILENTVYLTSLFTKAGDGKIVANFYNQNDRKRYFRYGIGIKDAKGNVSPIQTFRSSEPLDKNQPLIGCEFDIKQLLKKPGKYCVVPISRQENHKNWRFGRSYADVTVGANGALSIRRHNRVALHVTRIALVTRTNVGVRQKLKVSLSNEFDNYKGNLYLFASLDPNQRGRAQTMTRVSVSGGENAVAELSFLPVKEGRYSLWFSTDKKGDRVIGRTHLDIKK